MTEHMRDRQRGQEIIEALLGRMLTDDAFRNRFFAQPAIACAEHGFDLTAAEIAPLLRFDARAISDFAKRLDPRIVRAVLGPSPRRATTQGPARNHPAQTVSRK